MGLFSSPQSCHLLLGASCSCPDHPFPTPARSRRPSWDPRVDSLYTEKPPTDAAHPLPQTSSDHTSWERESEGTGRMTSQSDPYGTKDGVEDLVPDDALQTQFPLKIVPLSWCRFPPVHSYTRTLDRKLSSRRVLLLSHCRPEGPTHPRESTPQGTHVFPRPVSP